MFAKGVSRDEKNAPTLPETIGAGKGTGEGHIDKF